jgi:hypothetical protein
VMTELRNRGTQDILIGECRKFRVREP